MISQFLRTWVFLILLQFIHYEIYKATVTYVLVFVLNHVTAVFRETDDMRSFLGQNCVAVVVHTFSNSSNEACQWGLSVPLLSVPWDIQT